MGQSRRQWGWHQLSPRHARQLVADADLPPGSLVLDIGAGRGAITAPLLDAGHRVIAVEAHRGRAAHLERHFGGQVTVVRTDARQLRLPRRPFHIVASPPYAITSRVPDLITRALWCGCVELDEVAFGEVWAVISPVLDERQRRVVAGGLARACGRGGITGVARATGMSRSTVNTGSREVASGDIPQGRVRRPGAGRPSTLQADPEVLPSLDSLVEPESRGDPMSPLRWTTKSLRNLSEELERLGHKISTSTVADLLRYMGYSLQAPSKQVEGRQHPDRDGQFRYINTLAGDYLATGDPVISVDAKKKELVGNKANGGKEYQPAGQPDEVDVHDFPDPEIPKAIPYGVYDIGANNAWVSVGDDHDTAAFAVATIGRWWDTMGSAAYPNCGRLLVTADAGGSNSYRGRLWKVELAKLAERSGLDITVCHYPPGTSKWNKIEHRLFSQITMNWRGRPLLSHEVVVNLIAATTTRTGLTVQAALDEGYYPTGIRITDAELAALPLTPHDWHGQWNYTLTAK